MNMLIALILVSIALLAQTVYFVYYKQQIKHIGKQLSFISKNHSFKFIHVQIGSKEIYELVQLCNVLLHNQRELNQQYIQKHEDVNATIVSLSHDIRTPLTSLGGYLQLADSEQDLSKKTRYLQLAQTRMKQIVALVDELFYYTKLQNPEYNLDLVSLDVIDVLHKRLFAAVDAFTLKEQEPDLSRLPESPIPITGDIQALERVFENIIGNYILHGEGQLSISCEDEGHEVSIYFSNKVKNAQAIQVDKIFNRFYKDDPSRTLHSSGLGLSIVKSLVEKMNGSSQVILEGERFCLRVTFTKSQGRKADGSS
ncbi:sensor histidine kinase [Paenibacillaceae bacterium WGS1546]|uniref:sensor histidine kinase n=1 Tax=Cohnella sp. WGS1546 TaxID=3366810 RepID=UPI00372D3061